MTDKAPSLKNTVAQVAFILGAAVAVYGFVQAAKNDQQRAACTAVCALGPKYGGTNLLAPDFELPDLDGKLVKLSSFRGKTVVLNFWASWCDPCKEEMPSLGDLAKVLEKRDDIVLLTVSVDEDPKAARDTLAVLLASETIPFPVLMDPEMKVVQEKYGTRLYPETWIIDPDGYVRLRFDGAEDWSHAIAIEAIESVSRGRGCVVEFREGRALAPYGKLCESD
jgi:peroxiredoxin